MEDSLAQAAIFFTPKGQGHEGEKADERANEQNKTVFGAFNLSDIFHQLMQQ